MTRHRELTVWLPTFSGRNKKRDAHHYSAGEGHFLESRVFDDGTLEVKRYQEPQGVRPAKCLEGCNYGPGQWAWTEYDVE